eukprot:scaffold1833_cov263-Chaetoceros_neogracile.AAC.21
MNGSNLFSLCEDKKWSEMREYLSSDAAEEEKKSNIMHSDGYGTCLQQAFCCDAPDDIIKAMIDIGGKELIMKVDDNNGTALHWACVSGASYNIIKMLINVGGKYLIMAKDDNGDTALHNLCLFIKSHTKAAEKIKLILQVCVCICNYFGDANLLLATKDYAGQTPLEIATEEGASNIIKKLLTLQSTTNSRSRSSNPSAIILPADNSTPITQSNQDQDTTPRSSANNEPNIPIYGLGIDQNHQSQLKKAKDKAQMIQQVYDQKCIDYSDLEENFQSQLKDAKEQIMQIQQDYDQKCADCCHLKEENQLENTEKLELGSALDMLKKELYQCKKSQGAEISRLAEQEGETARAQELLVESNRRAADLEATVETQRLKIADQSNEKDDIEEEFVDKVDKLTRELSKQQAELQLLKDSSSMKRKHTNKDHKEREDTVVQSQSQSSKRSKVENPANISLDFLDRKQAEDNDDDALMMAGQLVQNNMLMSWYMAIRKRLRSANA